MRVTRNAPEVWEALLEQHGPAKVYQGGGEHDESYWEHGAGEWRRIKEFLPDLSRVLEYACGDGRIGRAAWTDCAYWVGYDHSAEIRARCRGTFHLDAAVVDSLDVLDGVGLQLSAIYCWNACIHFDYDSFYEFAYACRDHLVPGGRVVFDFYSTQSGMGQRIYREWKCRPGAWPLYAWHPDQVHEMFRLFGLELAQADRDDAKDREIHVYRKPVEKG